MKKLLALILALAMTGSVAAYAQERPASEEDIMLISEDNIMLIDEENVEIPDTRIVEGKVIAVSDEQIEIEDLVFNIGEETLIADCNLIPTEVKEGDEIYVVASAIETLSIPAQTPAYYVIVKGDVEVAPIFVEVSEVKDGFIYSADGIYKVSYEMAQVEMYRTKNIVKAEELTKGSKIFVYANMMTMSIPALVNPEKIVIMSIEEANTAEELEESDDVTEEVSDKRVVEGVVKAVSDEQIELEDIVLNIDENTLIAGTDLVPTQVKAGDTITAVASTAATFSIPPQSYAYNVVVRKNAEEAAPIYVEVSEVKDGFIYSADGNYKVSYESAQVEMYRTKNIVKAEELTKGSEIFVYANMMTMSIPALVNPEKIVIMSIAENENAKALALNEQGILLGTYNGLELDREVTRAEAVTLIYRTTMVDRMVYVSNFDDVSNNHWAYNYISWATEKGIVQGVGDNKFEPNRTVTGKELAKMLLNAQHIEVEFEDAFKKAVEVGYVSAEDGISEDDVLSRSAVAKMIYNYLVR